MFKTSPSSSWVIRRSLRNRPVPEYAEEYDKAISPSEYVLKTIPATETDEKVDYNSDNVYNIENTTFLDGKHKDILKQLNSGLITAEQADNALFNNKAENSASAFEQKSSVNDDEFFQAFRDGLGIDDNGDSTGPYADIADSRFVGDGKKFTPAQKRKIIQKNIEKNGGLIKSDISGEILVQAVKNMKGITPNPLEVQIDHIMPKSKGGSNSYSNAQVLSRKENIKKSNK